MTAHGHFHWMELNTHDREKAKIFYGETLGWTFEDMPMGEAAPYVVCRTGEDMVAGFFTLQGPDFANVPDHWLGYIAVDDIDKTVEKAKSAGGSVLREPFDVQGVGRIAILKDSNGAVSGYMTPSDD